MEAREIPGGRFTSLVGPSWAARLVLVLTLAGCGSDRGGPVSAATYSDSSDGGAHCCATSGSSGAGTLSSASSGDSNSGASSANDDDTGPSTAPSSCADGPNITALRSGYMGDWVAGDYPSNFSAGNYLTISGVAGQMGNTRQYAVHVPTGYSKDTPVPALFCLHGLAQNAVMFCLDTGVAWPTKADQEGFVVIMPNGYMNSWNAGTCCGGAVSAGLDDVALMRAIFAEVSTHVNLDLRRVYATGLSNGAFLSYRLACEASDLFVAIAPASGAVGTAAIGATPLRWG